MYALTVNCFRSLALGVFLGTVYDAIRLLRILFSVSAYSSKKREFSVYSHGVANIFARKRGRIFSSVFLAVTDLAFFFVSAVAFILFLYVFNYGIFRWFFLVFAVFGFLIYYNTVGRLFVSASTAISSYLMLVLNLLAFAAVYPFRVSFRLMRRFLSPVKVCVNSTLDKIKNRSYTLKCIKKLKKYLDV